MRVLIIEDEPLLAFLVEDMVAELGHESVRVVHEFQHAREAVKATDSFDVVVLDVNLKGCTSYAIADALEHEGKPFLFASGYDKGSLPRRFHRFTHLQKPYRTADLKKALCAAMAH